MLIADRLKDQARMSDVEQRIASYFLTAKNDIRHRSLRTIGSQVYASHSSIMRFCQKLGFGGYSDFREAYLQELSYLSANFKNIDPNYPFLPDDDEKNIANKLATLYNETISDTLGLLDIGDLGQAIAKLRAADTIYVASSGVNISLADVFKDNMLRIGKSVITFHSNRDVFFEACYRDQRSCFIIISYTGETSQIIKVARKVKERQLPAVALTAYGDNTLSQLIPCCLRLATRQKLISNVGSFTTHISVSYLLDILYAGCFTAAYADNLRNKIANSQIYESDRDSDNPILKENR